MSIIIECPICNWQPDGLAYWRCTCGNAWNTFDTKAKCPDCSIQWEKTYCPGCGKSSPHVDWYVDTTIIKTDDTPEIAALKKSKKNIETRLIALGIRNYRIAYLPYLDLTKVEFQNPYDAGCRMIILHAISYSAHNLTDRPKIIEWLKKENLWEQVSNNEKEFLNSKKPDKDTLMDLSWRLEASLVLGWALDLFDTIHEIDTEETDYEMETFVKSMPHLGGPTSDFLKSLKFRNLIEIYEENLLNEIATSYFRDLAGNGKRDETEINRMVSYERHRTLNWIRKFCDIDDWDDIDTST